MKMKNHEDKDTKMKNKLITSVATMILFSSVSYGEPSEETSVSETFITPAKIVAYINGTQKTLEEKIKLLDLARERDYKFSPEQIKALKTSIFNTVLSTNVSDEIKDHLIWFFLEFDFFLDDQDKFVWNLKSILAQSSERAYLIFGIISMSSLYTSEYQDFILKAIQNKDFFVKDRCLLSCVYYERAPLSEKDASDIASGKLTREERIEKYRKMFSNKVTRKELEAREEKEKRLIPLLNIFLNSDDMLRYVPDNEDEEDFELILSDASNMENLGKTRHILEKIANKRYELFAKEPDKELVLKYLNRFLGNGDYELEFLKGDKASFKDFLNSKDKDIAYLAEKVRAEYLEWHKK
jgi:hypothetical protein